jgi:hypothetical protein
LKARTAPTTATAAANPPEVCKHPVTDVIHTPVQLCKRLALLRHLLLELVHCWVCACISSSFLEQRHLTLQAMADTQRAQQCAAEE